MAQNNKLKRAVGTVDYEAGTTKTLELPQSHYLLHLNCLADYDITVNTADTPQNGNGVLELISNLEVRFDGSSTLKSQSLATSHFVDWYQRGSRPRYDPLDLSSATQQTGKLQTFVDAQVHPAVATGMFPMFATSSLELRVTWANSSEIADDVTINDASLSVESVERRHQTVRDSYLNNYQAFREVEKTEAITASGETSIELDRGNKYYAVAVQIEDDDTPDNDLVEGVTLRENGVDIHRSTTVEKAREGDRLEFGLEKLAPGFFILNYGTFGDLTDVVDSAKMDQYELVLNTDGDSPTDPAQARVLRQQLVE
jgi:hypothetical protein